MKNCASSTLGDSEYIHGTSTVHKTANSRNWIRKVLGSGTLILADLCARQFEKAAFTAKDIEKNSVRISREHADLDIRTKSSYHVLLNNHTFMFVADSNNLDSKIYEHIASYIGPVNKLFVGMECKGAPLS